MISCKFSIFVIKRILQVGIISDTHSFVHTGIKEFLKDCDEIWHCGDIGDRKVITEYSEITKVRAVQGNIDYGDIKTEFKEYEVFNIEGFKVLLIHIAGTPSKYNSLCMNLIISEKPNILVCGHSHILKVMYDKKNELLFINPGAAGIFGNHNFITAVRLKIEKGNCKNLEVYEYRK